MKVKSNNFTIIPNNNADLYSKNSAFNILHVYIIERVRSFEKQGQTCYMRNEQFAEVTGFSEKTISRAIKLLVDEKVLWAGYHYQNENDQTSKQRVLRIFNEQLEEYNHHTKGQNVQERWTNCLSQIDKMTSSDGQNVPLVYKENIKEYNYKKSEETNSSLLDSQNAHPEENRTHDLGRQYRQTLKSRRRSLETIENNIENSEDE